MTTNLKNGYGISFNEWVLDNDIKNELRLLLIISSLSANKGYCNASNKYFAELFNETEENISRKLNKLVKNGYLEIEYDKKGSSIIGRKLRLIKISMVTVDKNINGDNLIKINNNKERNIIINNNISKEKFKKPTIEEIQEYCFERRNRIDANYFYDFYESKGWMIGKNKMKDWKSAIRTWERNHKEDNKNVRTIPNWFNQEIEVSEEKTDDEEFKDFIEEFRNAK